MNQEINSVIVNTPDNYGNFYVENVTPIFEYAKEKQGVKTDTYILDFERELDKIRFSAIFSDFSNIYPVGLGKQGGNVIIPKNQTISLTVNEKILNAVIKENQTPILNAGFAVRNPNELSKFLRTIEPLIQSERVLVHNSRIILGLTNKKAPNGKSRIWETWNVLPDSPVGNWLAAENGKKQNSIPIEYKSNQVLNESEMFNLTIPYLKGISFEDLDKILNDNSDLLSSFRVNLRDLISSAKKDGKNIEEMKNDIIRPQVDQLNRKFKNISNIRALKIAGTVFSSVTLGLLSFSAMGLGAVISGFVGSSGLGLVVKHEVDYKKEIEKLEEAPLYLMWKLKKEK